MLILIISSVSATNTLIDTIRDKGKIGNNDLGIGGLDKIDLWITSEIVSQQRFTLNGWEYVQEVEITNKGLNDLTLYKNSFGGTGIDYELLVDKESKYLVPDKDNCVTNIDAKTGEKETTCGYWYVPCESSGSGIDDGKEQCIDWKHSHYESSFYKSSFPKNIKLKHGEKQKVYFKYFSWLPNGKWDFWFSWKGNKYIIDPYWSRSVTTSDVNHNFDYNGWVYQRPSDSSWTVTGELDWNKDAVADNNSWKDANLIAYWKMNESIGTTVFDSAGTKNCTLKNGIDINGIGLWDTNTGDFDGVNDYVDCGQFNLLDNKSNFSISAWVLLNAYGSSASSQVTIVGEWQDYYATSTQNNFSLAHRINIGNPIFNVWTSAGRKRIIGNSRLLLGKWYHLVGTYDGTNVKIYVNGELDGTTTHSGSIGTSSKSLKIGKNNYSNINGLVDEVKIWDKALTEDEIIADYNQWKNNSKLVSNEIIDGEETIDWNNIIINKNTNYNFGSELHSSETYFFDSNLVGLWHLNNNVNDSSSNGNNGSFYGDANASVAGLWDTNAGGFDGDGDYIVVTNNGSLDFNASGNYTFSLWVKPNVYDALSFFSTDHATEGYSFFMAPTEPPYVNVYFLSNNDPSGHLQYALNFETDKWYNLVVTYYNENASLYVNGVLVESSTSTENYLSSNSNFSIGKSTQVPPFNGSIEEMAIWDKLLTNEQIKELYRKGITNLDLNVYSCEDSSCENKTSSFYIENAENNSLIDISSLITSRYLGYDAIFTNQSEFNNFSSNQFWINAFLHDFNLGGDYNNFDLTFNVWEEGGSTNLTGIEMDCNNDSADFSGKTSPFTEQIFRGAYDCNFSVSNYDVNNVVFVADADKNIDVYLHPTDMSSDKRYFTALQFGGDSISTTSTSYSDIFVFDYNTQFTGIHNDVYCVFDSNFNSKKSASGYFRLQNSFDNGLTWNTIQETTNGFGAEAPTIYRSTLISGNFEEDTNLQTKTRIRLQQRIESSFGGSKELTTNNPLCQIIIPKDLNNNSIAHEDYSFSGITSSTSYTNVYDFDFNNNNYKYYLYGWGSSSYSQSGSDGTPEFYIQGNINDNNIVRSSSYPRTVSVGSSGSGGLTFVFGEIEAFVHYLVSMNIEQKTTAGTSNIDYDLKVYGIGAEEGEVKDWNVSGMTINNTDWTLIGTKTFNNKNDGTDANSFIVRGAIPFVCSESNCTLEVKTNLNAGSYDVNSKVNRSTSAETIGDYRILNGFYLFEHLPVQDDISLNIYARTNKGTITTQGGNLSIVKTNYLNTNTVYPVTIEFLNPSCGVHMNSIHLYFKILSDVNLINYSFIISTQIFQLCLSEEIL